MLKPLQQWICDSCGEIINSPKQGYVEWMETRGKVHGFRIVHHALYSPYRYRNDCYYKDDESGGDCSVRDLIGIRGLVNLTSWIDVGEWHDPQYSGPRVRDLREWTTLFRRLFIPYYEEARHCTDGLRDELGGAANAVGLYLPETLKRIIEEHEAHAA